MQRMNPKWNKNAHFEIEQYTYLILYADPKYTGYLGD